MLAAAGKLVEYVQPPMLRSTFIFLFAFFRRYSCLTQPYALFPTSFQAEKGCQS